MMIFRKVTDVFQINKWNKWRCRYPVDVAQFAVRSFKQHVLRQACVRRKCDCRNGRELFLSAALNAKTKREVAQFNSHFDIRGSPNASWEKRDCAKQKGTKGKSKAFYEVSILAHWIAIKYLYHYICILKAHCSGLLARYRRPYATRISGFFVIDYKSLFPLIVLPCTRQAIFAVGSKKYKYLFREFTNKVVGNLNPSSARNYFGTHIFWNVYFNFHNVWRIKL